MKETKKGKDSQMKPKGDTNLIKTNTRLGRSKLNKWVLGEVAEEHRPLQRGLFIITFCV